MTDLTPALDMLELLPWLKRIRRTGQIVPLNLELAQTLISGIEAVKQIEEALTPSGETKAAYIGEFGFNHVFSDDDGIEHTRYLQVPWTTIKEIMKAIKASAMIAASTPQPKPAVEDE